VADLSKNDIRRISATVNGWEREHLHEPPAPPRRGVPHSPEVRTVNITSATVDGNGRYPAQIQSYDVAGDAWSNVAECRVESISGTLGTGRVAAIRVGDDGTYPVLSAVMAGGTGGGGVVFSGARVYRTADATLTKGLGYYIEFQAERWDTDSYWTVGSPTRLTIPATGYYMVGAHVQIYDSTGQAFDGEATVGLIVNRATYIADQNVYPSVSAGDAAEDADPDTSISTLWYFTAGDYVEVRVFVDFTASAALSILGQTNGETILPMTAAFSCDFWITRMDPAISSAGGITDGDKGDVTVSSSGTVWTIDNDAVTPAKMNDGAACTVLGRSANSSGDRADITLANGEFLGRRSDVVDGYTLLASDLPLLNGFTDESAVADADRIPFYDASAGANRDCAASELKTYMGAGYTDEQAQDAVGTILDDGGDIDFTYNDGVPTITAAIKTGVVTSTHLADFDTYFSETPVAADCFPFCDVSGGDNNQCTLTVLAAALIAEGAATQAQMEADSSTTVAVTPGRLKYGVGVEKAGALMDASSGTPTTSGTANNITSWTDRGVGLYTANFGTSFADSNYRVNGTAATPGTYNGFGISESTGRSSSAYPFATLDNTFTLRAMSRISISLFGDF
jgi:hypothetical protein